MQYVAYAVQAQPRAEIARPFEAQDDQAALDDAKRWASKTQVGDVKVYCVEKSRQRRVK